MKLINVLNYCSTRARLFYWEEELSYLCKQFVTFSFSVFHVLRACSSYFEYQADFFVCECPCLLFVVDYSPSFLFCIVIIGCANATIIEARCVATLLACTGIDTLRLPHFQRYPISRSLLDTSSYFSRVFCSHYPT